MTRLTLVLLVDALRHDYVARTTYLRQLALTSTTGRLREDAGFLPRASYFGGLGPSEIGFTNMFARDPEASPFGLARGLPSSPAGRLVEDQFGLRRLLETHARTRVTPYAASYLWTGEIPLDLLPEFYLVEQRAPWDPRVGYRSVFHELDDLGVPYVTCAWPESNRLPDPSDRGIVDTVLDAAQPPVRLVYTHLQQLDAVGHEHGPESPELQRALNDTDQLIAHLVTTLEARYDQVDLVLFGDHGMVSVVGTTDVEAALDHAGIRMGRDVVAFLDSTMARFWFRAPAIRARVAAALAPLRGHVLDKTELRALDLEGCDPRNGEMMFLADAGVLVSPNFFQRRGALVRGMHGYHPDVPDNQGLFLVRDTGASSHAEIGPVKPTMVHATIRRQLGLGLAQEVVATGPAPQTTSPFTADGAADADTMVRAHLTRIVEEARRVAPDIRTVLLNGSFGRGEGGVTRVPDGRPRPVNDYDVLVLSAAAPGSQSPLWRSLGDALAREFDTDFVHFHVTDSLDGLRTPTLSHFDIRHGSRLVWGDRAPFDALPALTSGEVPISDGLQLLLNRLAGVLAVVDWPDGPQTTEPRARRCLRNQVMKGLMAIGDWHLLAAQAYACSYATRRERLRWIGPALGLDGARAAAVDRAYHYKLHPDEVADVDLEATVRQTLVWLVNATSGAIARVTGRPVHSAVHAAACYDTLVPRTVPDIAGDNAWVRRTLADNAMPALLASPSGSARHHVYAAMPLLGAAALGDTDAFIEASRRLSGCFSGTWPDVLTHAHWSTTRERLGRIWLTLVH